MLRQIGRARRLAEAAMVDTFTRVRGGGPPVPDDSGGWTDPAPEEVALAGRLVSRRVLAPEGAVGGVPLPVTVWTAWFPVGTDLRPGDTLRLRGVTFQVADDDDLRSEPVALVAQLRLVRRAEPA